MRKKVLLPKTKGELLVRCWSLAALWFILGVIWNTGYNIGYVLDESQRDIFVISSFVGSLGFVLLGLYFWKKIK